jgi:hypothetical protein
MMKKWLGIVYRAHFVCCTQLKVVCSAFMNLCRYACMATHAWLQHLQMGEAQPIILKRAYSEPKVSQRTRDGQLAVREHASKRNNSNRAFNLTAHIPYPDHSCWRLYLCSLPNLSLSTSYRHGSRQDLNHQRPGEVDMLACPPSLNLSSL